MHEDGLSISPLVHKEVSTQSPLSDKRKDLSRLAKMFGLRGEKITDSFFKRFTKKLLRLLWVDSDLLMYHIPLELGCSK